MNLTHCRSKNRKVVTRERSSVGGVARAAPRGATTTRALGCGLLAGALGTAAMDVLLYRRYRQAGGEEGFGDWESSADVTSWEAAPAPAAVGRLAFERLAGKPLVPSRARLTNNLTHWSYGTLAGAPYAILSRSLRAPSVLYGLPFGATVWAASYVVLPALGLYEPIWRYDAKTLGKDLSAHLVYGLSTAIGLRALAAD